MTRITRVVLTYQLTWKVWEFSSRRRKLEEFRWWSW